MCMSNNVPMMVCCHCTGDARFCVSTVRNGVCMGCDGLLVRRKILRLYSLEPLYVNVLWEIMI